MSLKDVRVAVLVSFSLAVVTVVDHAKDTVSAAPASPKAPTSLAFDSQFGQYNLASLTGDNYLNYESSTGRDQGASRGGSVEHI
jgi:hypothetical protein